MTAYIGSNGKFATDALRAYATQLQGLTLTQQKMALSTTNLSALQRKQVLDYMAETAAAKTLTAQQISELSIDQQKVLVNAGLITQDGLKTGATITLTKAELKKIIADEAILTKDKQIILSAFGVTEANLTEASSWEILGKSAGKALLSLATNPVTWAVAGIVAITAVTNAIWDTTKEIEERLEETKNTIQETESEISSIEQQIEANTQKLEEMRAAGMDESALQTYVKENEELNAQLQLLKDINEEAKKKIAPDVAKLVNNEGKQTAISKAFDQLMSGDIGGIIGDSIIGNLFSGAYFKSGGLEKFRQNLAQMDPITSLFVPFSDPDDDIIARTNDALKDYKKYQEKFDNLNETDFKSKEAYWEKQQELSGKIGESSSIIGNNISQLLEYRKELANSEGAETYYSDEIKKIDDIIKSYYSANPQSAFDYIFNQDSFSEVKSKLDDFSKLGLGELRKGIQDLIPVNGELYNELVDFGLITKDNKHWVDELATNFDFLSTNTEGTDKKLNKMTVSLSELEGASDKIKTLGSAFKELSDDGYITTKTLGEIQTATGLSGDEWAEYESKLLTAKKGSAEFSQIMADLTYKMLDQTFANKDLNSLTEQQISAILRENGVVNADAVAHDWLTKAKEMLRIKTALAKASTAEAVVALATEASQAGITGNALNDLIMDMGIFNNTNLDVSQKVAALQEMGYYAHWTAQGLANIDKVKKYSFDGKDYIASYDKDGKLVGIEQEKQVEIPNVEIPKITIPNYSGATSGGKSGSDKDKPDYEDPTDAIIDRINLRHRELEQQEEYIENAREIAELENDYKKQISLTNDKLAVQKQRLDALKISNNELHQAAEGLRNSTPQWNEEEWFDSQGNETEAYINFINSRIDAGADKEEIESIKDQFEAISKLKKAWVENDEEIVDLTQEIIQGEKDVYNILDDILSETERYTDRIKEDLHDIIDSTEDRVTKENAVLSVMQKQYETQNALAEAEHEANKAIAESRISYEYLDDDLRKNIYNEEDYQREIDKIKDVSGQIDTLTNKFLADINRAYEEDNIYLIETITAEYERQCELKERELEILRAEIDVQKKQEQLNNILAEKNVRMLVDGKWIWTHNVDNARQAAEELADAQYQVDMLNKQNKQQLQVNQQQLKIDGLNNEIGLHEKQIELLDEATDNLSRTIEDITDPIASIGVLADQFATFGIGKINSAVDDLLDAFGRITNKDYGSITSNATLHNDMSGQYVEFFGRKYYKGSQAYDVLSLPHYASGTKSAKPGLSVINEITPEGILSRKGALIPMANFEGGERVFTGAMMDNLWNIAKSPLSDLMKVEPHQQQPVVVQSGDTFGDITVNNPTDWNAFMHQLTTQAKAHNAITNRM